MTMNFLQGCCDAIESLQGMQISLWIYVTRKCAYIDICDLYVLEFESRTPSRNVHLYTVLVDLYTSSSLVQSYSVLRF